MRIWFTLLFFILLQFYINSRLVAQKQSCDYYDAGIMFYNVENLFDIYNNSDKNDDEFTPTGARGWSYGRFKEKITNISRVILTAGGFSPPVIVGLCEVENEYVLNKLIFETGLDNLNYKPVHYNSGDFRGVDVALLYRSDHFKLFSSYPVQIELPQGRRATRDILYAKGVLYNRDTLHLLVNHWPSRFGGVAATQEYREIAAETLYSATDSIFSLNQEAFVIVMGDFNEPLNSSIFEAFAAIGRTECDSSMIVMTSCHIDSNRGTIKYRYRWDLFDQIMVSRNMLSDSLSIFVEKPEMEIVDLPFLLEPDEAFGGKRPYRSYRGYQYIGGYSDHLPVWLNLKVKRE
ncbi:endonuclease [Marinilabiliaceae bacterium ANBcel2]|nr:endonuclease [Marinilabiliaceae bacterium ANBcel2]